MIHKWRWPAETARGEPGWNAVVVRQRQHRQSREARIEVETEVEAALEALEAVETVRQELQEQHLPKKQKQPPDTLR